VVVLLLAFEALVKYHQIQCRPLQSGRRPPPGVIFSQITRGDADTGLISCLKFFANYGFYRFGCEVRCAWKPVVSVYFQGSHSPEQVALLWQRDRATRLSVEILQLTKHFI